MITPRSPEYAFNLFFYKYQDWLVSVGCAVHPLNAEDAEMLRMLQAAVPRDAILAERSGWSPDQATQILPDGTPVVSYRSIQIMLQAGKELAYFEHFFRHYNAPVDPLYCLTIVDNGIPMNEAGPIYEKGDPEIDRRMRYELFLEKRLPQLEKLNAEQYALNGRGCLHCQPQPTPSEPGRRGISYLPIEATVHAGAFWDELRHRLKKYDPAREMLVCLHDADGRSGIYNLGLSKPIAPSSNDEQFWADF